MLDFVFGRKIGVGDILKLFTFFLPRENSNQGTLKTNIFPPPRENHEDCFSYFTIPLVSLGLAPPGKPLIGA
jgi:hypothetical protein